MRDWISIAGNHDRFAAAKQARAGLGQGVFFAKQPAAALHPLVYLEFGGYVFGTAVGCTLGISLLHSLIAWNPAHLAFFLTSAKVLLPWASVLLLAGAVIESAILCMMPFPPGTSGEDIKRWSEEFRRKQTEG